MNLRTLGLFALTVLADAQTNPDPRLLARWQWRNIGPATMGGRVSDIAGIESDPNLIYLATGSAGLFKSTNAGAHSARNFHSRGQTSDRRPSQRGATRS